MDDLMAWKARPHKCLIVKGQRQIGKTFIIKEFSKTYGHTIYVDFSTDTDLIPLFDGRIDIDRIVLGLRGSRMGEPLDPSDTLIVFDEIQLCPRAKGSLKQFTIDGRYDVIASGSLIDIPWFYTNDPLALSPKGYVENIQMHSMDFEEFLWAKGYSEDILDHVKDAIRERTPIIPTILGGLDVAFREFMVVGGMPEAVDSFVNGRGMDSVLAIQDENIVETREDIIKYSPSTEALKIRRCLDSLPNQLAQSNKKFMYSRIDDSKSKSGAKKYSDALVWINDSGLGNPCYQLNGIVHPVTSAINVDQFKVYVSDTGILTRMCDIGRDGALTAEAVLKGDTGYNQGAIVENVVAECLMKSGFECCYYLHRKNPGRMELDFVLNLGKEVTAIEVKSGKAREAASLNKTMNDDRFQRRIMLEHCNIHVDPNGVEHYPLFVAAFLDVLRPKGTISGYVPDDVPVFRLE